MDCFEASAEGTKAKSEEENGEMGMSFKSADLVYGLQFTFFRLSSDGSF